MKRLPTLLLLLLVYSCSSAESEPGRNGVLRIRDGKTITFAQMMDEVRKVNLVFVGEIHDIPAHHRDELAVIRAFHEADTPLAVGLEMFRSDSQEVLNSWAAGKLTVEKFLPAYYDNWQMSWSYYRDIFLYARDHGIPLVGLNIPDGISKKVARQGFASLTAKEKKLLPPGISCNVDARYMDFIRQAYAGHRRSDRAFVNFCEAQMVWDKSMAWRLMDYHKEHPATTVVVLAGIGHSWKRGIPEQVGMESKLSYRVILPDIPDQIDQESITTRDADYLLLE